MNIKRLFNRMSFFQKELLVYVAFAILPMLFVTVYNYRKTSELLSEQSHQEMRQTIEATGKSLDTAFGSYETIMDLIFTNQKLYSYLRMDYQDLSYWEMFDYIDGQMNSFFVVNPGIECIRFYSTNDTLPQDNYYFYRKENLPREYASLAETNAGSVEVGGLLEEKGEQRLVFFRRMNHYSTGTLENYLMLQVSTEIPNQYLTTEDGSRRLYLVSRNGEVLASSDGSEGRRMGALLPEWKSIPSEQDCAVQMDGRQMVGIRRPLSVGGMSLVLLCDRGTVTDDVNRVTRSILLIFFASAAVAVTAIRLYGKRAAERVNKVVYAAQRLGEGKFDYILTDMGGDEIGKIADAYNVLNGEIQTLIHDNYEKKLLLKTSEVNLLQEQINPHFLYNALSMISSTAMREGGRKTVESVRSLSDFYRISLNKGLQVLSVKEELDLLKSYMKIQKARFGDMVEIIYEINEAVYPYRAIKLILQPLVENAIHHGRKEECVLHILVRADFDGEDLLFLIRDDGSGITPENLSRLKEEMRRSQGGFGLKNVDIRVKLHYGENYGVRIRSEVGIMTEVTVRIPQILE